MNRREFMFTAGGVTGAMIVSQPVAAQDGGEDSGGGGGAPDFGDYLQDANLYSEGDVVDARGDDRATIAVGAGGDGLGFDPPAIWISPGTTVTWEWTGDGGGHNVVPEEGPASFEHPDIVSEQGYTFEHEFTEEEAGITTYHCEPHESQGMKGGVAVGDDVPTVDAAEAGMKEPNEFGTDIHEHWVGITVILMIVVSLIFTFFVLKYGESPHTSGGT